MTVKHVRHVIRQVLRGGIIVPAKIKKYSGLLLMPLLLCCGAMGTPGEEPAGLMNLPNAAVAPYIKIDVDEDPVTASQPFISLPPESGGLPIHTVTGNEPCVLRMGSGESWMWYEEYGTIFIIRSTDGEYWRGLDGDDPTETRWNPPAVLSVGAPSVLHDPADAAAPFKMWYTVGNRLGIGFAVSQDGVQWTRAGTGEGGGAGAVLVPCLEWEGGAAGGIGSPSVILDDGLYRMWYDGESVVLGEATRHIGYAQSADGTVWFKMDPLGARGQEQGHITEAETCTPEQSLLPLEPVLSPNPIVPCTPEEKHEDPQCKDWALRRNWEWTQVWAPYVMRDDSSLRKVYKMYYTGGVLVLRELDDLPSLFSEYSTSVGFAGSWDGLSWIKQRIGINPVLDEPFPLDLGGFMEFWCQTLPPVGENIFCMLKIVLSEVSVRILTNEYTPSVLPDGEEYKMWFRQNDLLNIAMPEHYEGVSLAINPPEDIF